MSIQGSSFHYSTPREDDGPYTEVEVGYIEDGKGNQIVPPDTWKQYAESGFPSDVYAYVPINLVQEFCDKHGGIKIHI